MWEHGRVTFPGPVGTREGLCVGGPFYVGTREGPSRACALVCALEALLCGNT